MRRLLLVNKFATIAGMLARTKASHTWLLLFMYMELNTNLEEFIHTARENP
jgi:hypothetical protein